MGTFERTLVFVCLLLLQNVSSEETVEYFENIIQNGIQDALNYEVPTDASFYRPKNTTVKDYGSFDFVIIGGGTTGAVIARRLSDEKKFSVLVIEAGDFADNGILQIPKYSQTGWRSFYNWGFKSIPQNTSCLGTINHECAFPRGRGVGGTTLMNGIVYDRGAPDTFNIYADIVDDQSWSYKNILKYYKKSENFHWTNPIAPVDLSYHGTKGLIDVQHQVPNNRLNDVFLQANRDLNIPIRDYNGPIHIGGSIAQIYTKKGRRVDTGTAYVKPVLKRKNLKVLTRSYATKILFSKDKVAERVLFNNEGNTYSVKAKKEIIISAGSVSSPPILIQSGIGPKKHLEELGIEVLEDLEVGTKFLDQPGIKNFMFTTSYPATTQTLREQIEDFLNGTGILTSATYSQGLGFYNFRIPIKTLSDIEVICDLNSPSELDKKVNNWNDRIYEELWDGRNTSITFNIRHLYPISVGTLKLKSKDPYEYPLIDTNYLSDPDDVDVDVMYQAIQFVFKLIETPAFKKINMTYSDRPLTACKEHKFKSKEYWYCFIRQTTLTAAHPVGTCAMGANKSQGAVVDTKLRVFGVKRLRVADASVFPAPFAGHSSMACVMLGEKASDIIKKDHGKKCYAD